MKHLARALAWLAPDGGLSSPLRWLAAKAGFSQVLTSRAAIVDLLDDATVTVPYHERSEPLGLHRFPLALDGAEHAAARALVLDAVVASDGAHRRGCADAERLVAEVLADASGGGALDLVAEVVDPALTTWVARWFGLPGWGPALQRCGRLITHATFLNPPLPEGRVDLDALRLAVDHVTVVADELEAPMAAAPAGTLSHALLRLTGGDASLSAQHLLGLTVGPLALTSKALALSFDALLDEPRTVQALADDLAGGGGGGGTGAGGAGGEATFRRLLRAHPPLPGVLRRNPAERQVPGRRGGVTVPAGLVMAATSCPLHQGDVDLPDLVFGYGRHRCLGAEHTTRVGGLVVGAVGAARPSRHAGARGRLVDEPAPTGVRSWPFPGHLEVVLTG